MHLSELAGCLSFNEWRCSVLGMSVHTADCIVSHLKSITEQNFIFEMLLIFFSVLTALLPDNSTFMNSKLSGET